MALLARLIVQHPAATGSGASEQQKPEPEFHPLCDPGCAAVLQELRGRRAGRRRRAVPERRAGHGHVRRREPAE